jgi:hypothetical protein
MELCRVSVMGRGPMITVVCAVAFTAGTRVAAAERSPGFNRDVRPILSENCFFCHGPDRSKRKAGLRLDLREAAVEDGAIVPGKPADSELIRRIVTRNPDDVMPPPDTHKTITPAQRAVLERWIAQGAPYEPHWSYVPVRRPPVPRPQEGRWVRNPVDAFVLAALEPWGLSPSPEADRRTLLRRLALDLVGLPPGREELASFAVDGRADALERAVDRLLASPHFGERMAVPWLDVVRFADTVGYHGDQNQNVFPYRDYVIDAFNHNKRFDAFTIEQLAGDLLPRPSNLQIVATGFNRLNMVTREGGAQAKEYLAKYLGDRVRAVGTAWLGSTFGCAECHDHKYDPITMRDFYSLGAFFADVTEWGVYHDYKYTPNSELKGWSNDHPFPPEIVVESSYLERRAERLRAEQGRVVQALDRRLRGERAARAALAAFVREADRFLRRHGDGFRPAGPVEVVREKKGESAVEIAPGPGWLAALRLELVPHPEHGGSALRAGAKESPIIQFEVSRGGKPLAFHFAEAAVKESRYAHGHEILGVGDGWKVPRARARAPLVAVYQLAEPVRLAAGEALTASVRGDVGAFRIATSPLATLGLRGDASPGRALRRAPAELFALSTDAAPEEAGLLRVLFHDLAATRGGRAPTLVTVARAPRPIRILPRGNWQDDSGDRVEPATPHFLPALDGTAGRRLTRLDLARWLVSRENPLTARVFVNRLWRQFFGVGLSSVLDDLGAQGEPPSHPELLDWLAAELMDSGWDIKRLVRLVVTSATYRQSSIVRPELAQVDPHNRLLARQSQRRLDAEFVRDNVLAVAGLLSLDIGGPSVFPYQPSGYYENLEFPKREWIADRDDRQHRRGLYIHRQRTFLHPMLASFDAPSREECAAERPPSNTPQQALTLLNDPTFVEAARVFAASVLAERKLDDRSRLGRAFERATGRPPKPDEARSLRDLLAAHREHYRLHRDEARKLLTVGIAPAAPFDPAEQAAWTSVCRVVLNLYESVTRL